MKEVENLNPGKENKEKGLKEEALARTPAELLSVGFENLLDRKYDLDTKQIEILMKYKEQLLDWNQRLNLTAIEDEREVIVKHFLDSLSILPMIPNKGESLIDIGTGAGFPGIPVKIACEKTQVTLLDSLDKRVKFLNAVIEENHLKGIKAVHGRAEDFGVNPSYREKFDIAVARAVANLPVLLEYCLPFVKTGGIFIAMKGSNSEEVEAARKALDILGGKVEEVRKITLPFSDFSRNIIIVRKIRQTPQRYPRKSGKPSKEPLL
ncbi:MAG: 16S rRNA (guanine(527)-N(7))-methyltransferase RsmG [Clostridiales bacterium]|nr:16S rRNA (guanine(527)-N(7))-methyltransferase RsmG [Clostridiales bacterium]